MRKRLYFILFLFCSLSVRADGDFTVLDWNELRIDSLLPVYTEVVPLESDYRRNDYVVSVLYPEWQYLSLAETQKVKPFDNQISERLNIVSHVAVSRKVGVLDIAFCPIVREGAQYKKLLSGKIVITPVQKKSTAKRVSVVSTSDRYTRTSRLSTGKWVKISVSEDGIYRLSSAELRRMGFKDPNKVHLYGYGGHRLSEISQPNAEYDDLQEVPMFQRSGDWLFWGNGVTYWDNDERVINPYATAGCYFLTEQEENNDMQIFTPYQGVINHTFNTFIDHVLYEKDEYAYFHGGRNLYEAYNFASGAKTYRLETPNYVSDARLTIAFTAAEEYTTVVKPTLNGNSLKSMSLDALEKYEYGVEKVSHYPVASYANGETWNLRLSTSNSTNAHLDYLAMRYTRQLSVNNAKNFVAFSRSEDFPACFEIAGSDVVFMRIPSPVREGAVIAGTQNGNVFSVAVDDASARYVAFSASASYPSPTVVGEIANQNLHALDSLDMVIIVPESDKLTGQAHRLADAHSQYDGLRTAVIRADLIYNEFSSGTRDATAYRRFLKMLYDRAKSDDVAPKYLILMGDAAWDNRMLSSAWKNYRPEEYLLSYQSENSFSDVVSYVMEDYFGLLDDGEGVDVKNEKCDLGVGRFPVTSGEEAKIMVDKSIVHMSNAYAGSWKNIVSFIGDDGDENLHLRYADDVANRVISQYPQIETRKVMFDTYPRVVTATHNSYPAVNELLTKQVNDGALVMNYTGHAAAYTLSHEFVLLLKDFENLKGTNLPLWVAAACDVMPFDGQAENIGETAVLNPHGAAVAFYSTARTVYASENRQMNIWLMNYLFGTDAQGNRYRLGDAIRLAKNQLVALGLEGVTHRQNKLHYALLGDPALTFGAPVNRVVLDSINDQPANVSQQLKAGQLVTLTGHVDNAQAELLSDFSGILTTRVYDNEQTVTCLNNAGAKVGAFQFLNRDKILYSGQDSLRQGRFSIQFVMPSDINYSNQTGRMVFYAVSSDHKIEANGYHERFTVGGAMENADTLGPQVQMYLNTEDFENGGRVNSTPYFVAHLQDDSGINFSGNGLGHDLSLVIDNNPATTYVLNDSYAGEFGDFTRGTVSFSIPALSNGSHTLTFRCWDVLNNFSQQSLDFVVDNSLKPNILSIVATQNPAITTTNFLVSHDRAGSDCDIQIEVFNFAGQRMWVHRERQTSASGTGIVPWNLANNSGGRLSAGIYFYRVTLSCNGSKEVSKTQKIIINGNK